MNYWLSGVKIGAIQLNWIESNRNESRWVETNRLEWIWVGLVMTLKNHNIHNVNSETTAMP